MKRVTIYDVAKEANVSLATVSRVINGVDVVRADTRIRVEQAIEKLGYKPNAIAQGLALQKTTTIGLIIPEASFSFTGNIINGLVDVAHVYKYNIMLYTATEGITDVQEIIERIIKSRVDGVIVYNDRLDEDLITNLQRYQVPTVVINNKVSGDKLASVYVNIEAAVKRLVDDYLDRGLSNIAVIEDRKNTSAIQRVVETVKGCFQKRGMEFHNFLTIPSEYHTSYEFLKDHFKDHRYDLMLSYRDSQALATINAAAEQGLKIPDDMEVVCIMDTKYNSMGRPQISSFSIPTYDLGAVAMRVLTKMLKDDDNDQDQFEYELNFLYTKRGSTK